MRIFCDMLMFVIGYTGYLILVNLSIMNMISEGSDLSSLFIIHRTSLNETDMKLFILNFGTYIICLMSVMYILKRQQVLCEYI